MSYLSNKYAELKKKVGGNREIMHYEESFGMPTEELNHITMPGKAIRRILGELDFAIRLSSELGGKYDPDIDASLTYLLSEIEAEGVLRNSACMHAEKLLLPLAASAKEYKLILAGHAHIDMNWMWSWQETVAATLATFRTMLNIMDEYPDFCYSQSQSSVYKIVEDYEPEMMYRIKARIAEGRWEITSSAWVETDKNMPNTESLLRHIKYSKNYLRDVWGIDPDSLEVDFSPDTFGHSANLPEIDLHGSVKYYYHCRGLSGDQALYRWKGQSGKELLVYREQYWYNSGITPKIGAGLIDISKRCGGFKTGLIVYGVGDHGGGPTRRDVERAIEMASWPIFPEIKFGTFREFFKEAESVREKLPLIENELNFIMTGCYTTQSRIKKGNRHSEAALSDAENLGALARFSAGKPYRSEAMENAWRDVLFTHFHDILTGSCVQDSREHAMGLYSKAIAVANTEYSAAMRAISEASDTSAFICEKDPSSQSEGAGVGYNIEVFNGKPVAETGGGLTRIFSIFNPTAAVKHEPVEITVWDWTGDMRCIKVCDTEGNDLPFQLLDSSLKHYWDHKYFRILVYISLSPLSYTTIALEQGESDGMYPLYYQPEFRNDPVYNNFVLENEYIRAEFCYKTGALVSLIDAETGTEYIHNGKEGSFYCIETESSSSDAWHIGRYISLNKVADTIKISSVFSGSLRSGFTIQSRVRNSSVTAEIFLDRGARCFDIKTTVDWNEAGGTTVPVFAYILPLITASGKFMYDIPAGYIVRDAADYDVPGLTYAASVSGNGKNAAIITDSKYGYRGLSDGTLVSTLINSAVSPDPYPERGIHKITLSVGIFPDCPKFMEDSAQSAVRKLTYQSTGSHKGGLPASASLFNAETDGAVVSAVGVSDDGKLIIRMYSVSDDKKAVSFDFGKKVVSAFAVDLLEKQLTAAVSFEGSVVRAEIEPHTLLTLKIEL